MKTKIGVDYGFTDNEMLWMPTRRAAYIPVSQRKSYDWYFIGAVLLFCVVATIFNLTYLQ